MEDNLNLYQKLAKIRKQVEVIKKNKRGYNYEYVSDDEILARVSVFMDKYDISLIPGVKSDTLRVEPHTYKKVKLDKNGEVFEEIVNEVIVSADMTWTWVNNKNPEERIVVPWILTGQQGDSSRSFGSGLTYSNRYFLLKYFNIATPDSDPDSFRSKQKAAEAAEDKMVADGIIEAFDTRVRELLAKEKVSSEDVKKLVSKYVKNGNYFAIKESAVASKLLEEFEDKFGDKE